jgi:hypothetical protein
MKTFRPKRSNRCSHAAAEVDSKSYRKAMLGVSQAPEDVQTTKLSLKGCDLVNTYVRDDISFWEKGRIFQEQSLKRPMSEIGRLNNANDKFVLNSIVKGLRAAIKRNRIPAVVTIAGSNRTPHDFAIWPTPGALIKKTPVNCLHWMNTPKRGNAIFWSRELNGSRAWPKKRIDKALGLARFAEKIDGSSWLAVATRATSNDDNLLCRWIPQHDVMSYYANGACIPAQALFLYPFAQYNATERRFDITPELLAKILGLENAVAS